jgi:tRNA threonylcarbamoyladenosine biosynthesis protein TsaB
MPVLLAFDTATERMSIALAAGEGVWTHESEGGAQASAALIPTIQALLSQAGLALSDVDAIAFGRGPGAFTGLRTACSVAQGLAFGTGKPVLPIDTLLVVAEDARDGDRPQSIWVATDARMSEIYAACYAFDGLRWSVRVPPFLTTPELLGERWAQDAPQAVAGSALTAFASRLHPGTARQVPGAAPRALALLPLARSLWSDGGAVDAALAMPLYVRDKVAQTTAERDALRAAKDAIAAEAPR